MERRAGRVAAWASIIRQAFELKRAALPWGRAIGAGLSLGLPSLVGCVLGNFPSGMLAGTGGFAYLYAGKEPYALRSKKLFWAALGLALSVASGTLLASNPVLAALYLGAFGGFVTFLFGALAYKGPGALFFVMAFLLGSAMPVDSSQAFQRGGLALAGGLLAWTIGMLGWFAGPRAPEEQAISRLYGRLAQALNAVGTASYEEARHDALLQLYETEAIFVSTWVPRRANETFEKLQALFRQANAIYLEMNRFASASRGTLPPALGHAAGAIANAVRGGRADRVRELPEADGLERLELTGSIRQTARIWNGAAPPEERSKPFARMTPLWTILLGALDRNSIVLLLSLRFAAVLAFAALIARGLELNRSYWVPLSCASVMLGATVLATFHRAIQRSIGTMIGILAASAILSLRPEGYVVSFAIMMFTFGAELFLVRNYAITVLFVTPNALLMAEANSRIQDTVYFAGARLTDVLVGSLIGLAGVLLIGRRSASSRIPYLMARTLRSQAGLLALIFTQRPAGKPPSDSRETRDMKTHLSNLATVYATATGEIPRNEKELKRLLPTVWSIDQFGYLLNAYARDPWRETMEDGELALLLLALEKMAQSADWGHPLPMPELPALAGQPRLREEIASLGQSLDGSLEREGEPATS